VKEMFYDRLKLELIVSTLTMKKIKSSWKQS